MTGDVVLAVHGGAGGLPPRGADPAVEKEAKEALLRALEAGGDVLGDSSVAAVEAAVAVLEDASTFNAGRGSVFTEDATVELEAAIMDGWVREAGAVVLVSHVRNPVRLARLVMERSSHVALVGHAAELFAAEHGVELVPSSWFHTARRMDALLDRDPPGFGTVGAVALDGRGRLAAATSTGGITGKAAGRMGDTPVIGAGTYADQRVAVSGTGLGEHFVRAVAAHAVAALVGVGGLDVEAAASRVVEDIGRLGGHGGLISLDRDGRLATPFDTEVMYRGLLTRDGSTRVAIRAEPASA